MRKWQGKDYAPDGKTVFLTNASVAKPLPPLDDDYECGLIDNGCFKEAKHQWSPGHPPQKHARVVWVHVMFTLLRFALATAYRLQCDREVRGLLGGSSISPNTRCGWK